MKGSGMNYSGQVQAIIFGENALLAAYAISISSELLNLVLFTPS
jgi:hypothetical protein